jgi:hypothetical protein
MGTSRIEPGPIRSKARKGGQAEMMSPTVGHTSGPIRHRGACIVALVGSITALLIGASSASALIIEPPVYSGTSITGPTAPGAPAFGGLDKLAIDQASKSLYVASGFTRIYKFDTTNNQSAAFSALSGKTTLESEPIGACCGDISVDNTGTTTQGRIYTFTEQGPNHAYFPSGQLDPNFKVPSGTYCGAAVAPDGHYWLNKWQVEISEYDPLSGAATGKALFINGFGTSAQEGCDFEIDPQGNFYVTTDWTAHSSFVEKYSPSGVFQYRLGETGEALSLAIDPSNGNVFVDDRSKIEMYSSGGSLLAIFGEEEGAYKGISNSGGVTVDEHTHDVYVSNGSQVDIFEPGPAVVGPDVTTNKAVPTPTGASLRGTVNPSGVNTTECYFEWGLTTKYGNEATCAEGNTLGGSTNIPVSATIGPLEEGKTYNFRLVVKNTNGVKIVGSNRAFRTQGKPIVVAQFVNGVKGDVVRLNAELNPHGGETNYYFEYGTDTGYGTTVPVPEGALASFTGVQTASQVIHSLTLDTEYHYRVIATDDAGTTVGADRTFRTFPPFSNIDPCSNALARQQTGAVLLGHCRAYELVSAPNTGGYNVESDLVPGQEPLNGYPQADSRVLYGVHDGGIPNTGNPTNKGVDPYVATRGENGWTTEYVGLPADGMPSASPPFASPLIEADPSLHEFAFGGEDICNPCFNDTSTNIPLRLSNGNLVKGMAGSQNPTANPTGFVGQRFSADGTHFIFGADKKFESAGKEGSVSIYDRDLKGGITQVVSTLPSGATMGGEVGELAVSEDGSRIVVGQKVSTDAAGNNYWHLYMHLGGSANSVDLSEGTTTGVIFAGMTGDGSKVFFTTNDKLLAGDEDTSADLYVAEVGLGGGPATLKLLSAPAPAPAAGSVDSCDPTANGDGNNWNAVGGASANSCGVVAIGGGGGLATGNGTIYFLSPEKLDGTGTLNEPNLFVVKGSEAPHRVTTLEPGDPMVRDSAKDSEIRRFRDFQVTPNGAFAVFSVAAPLTGFENHGQLEVFRYDAGTQKIDCASCAASEARPAGNSVLSSHGLSVIDDGRVFFTSPDSLVLRDTDEKRDAYEWTNGEARLISSGTSPFDSGLLSATANGRDVYFFTRDTFVGSDHNGTLMKIYDAREHGGFFAIPEPPPCAASDECHGPSSATPPEPQMGSRGGTEGNFTPCKKGKGLIKKNGRCVKKHHRHHKRHNVRRHMGEREMTREKRR